MALKIKIILGEGKIKIEGKTTFILGHKIIMDPSKMYLRYQTIRLNNITYTIILRYLCYY